MKQTVDIMAGRCPQCGRPVEKPGMCPECSGEQKPKPEFKACMPPSVGTDCDCPVVGYTKIHAPWCKYF